MASLSRHQAEVSAHLHDPTFFNLFDYYRNSRHELLESCFKQVIRDSARLSACVINRTEYTWTKLKKKSTNAEESCVWEVERHWKIFSKIKMRRSKFGSVLLTQYCSGYQIEKNGMGGACNTYEGQKKCIQGFGGGT